jgi:hypothetical protein
MPETRWMPMEFRKTLAETTIWTACANDRPNFVGSSVAAAYSHNNPANGIFTDNNDRLRLRRRAIQPGRHCGLQRRLRREHAELAVRQSVGHGPRYGTLGRNVFRGPWFNGWDAALLKNFKVTEVVKLQLRFEALNVDNHPNFDGIDTNLNDGNFGKAQILIGNAISRRLQLGATHHVLIRRAVSCTVADALVSLSRPRRIKS